DQCGYYKENASHWILIAQGLDGHNGLAAWLCSNGRRERRPRRLSLRLRPIGLALRAAALPLREGETRAQRARVRSRRPFVYASSGCPITIELLFLYGTCLTHYCTLVHCLFHRHGADGFHGREDHVGTARVIRILHDLPRHVVAKYDDVLFHRNR